MTYLTKSLHWFKVQTKSHQLALAAGLSVMITTCLLLSLWATSPTYSTLFSHLASKDSSRILKQLDQEHIAYQIRHQGSELLIDKTLIDKTRLKLMGSSMGWTSSVGFELFDKSDFGMTDFSQKINFQRALQGELERTIASLDEVNHARVQLVLPEDQLFQHNENQPRAAVTLHLNKPLTQQQVYSIQQLVTASVARLSRKNVTIINQYGDNLTINKADEITTTHFKNKRILEYYLNEKITQLLQRIFANNQVIVSVDATINYDKLQRELVKPQFKPQVIHEKETQHSLFTKTEKKPTTQETTREKSYQLGSEKEQFNRASGRIERLTISVAVPAATKQSTIQQVERLIKSSVGFNAQRGDSITVEALITPQKPLHFIQHQPAKKALSTNHLILNIILGALIFFTVFFLLPLQKRRKKRQLLLTELTEWLNAQG